MGTENDRKRVTAIITAAGKGTRMNDHRNKQYIEIAGIPVLARTIQVFQDCSGIDDMIIVVNEEDINFCRHTIVEKYRFTKVRSLVSGGAERQNSVYRGLCAVENGSGIVLIHDGARPFVSDQNIMDCIRSAEAFGACGVGVKSKDTVKISDADGFVVSTPERKNLWSIQTPQGFQYDIITMAHQRAIEDNFTGTDDMMLVERLGFPVKIVEGDYRNIKITTPEDLSVAETMIIK